MVWFKFHSAGGAFVYYVSTREDPREPRKSVWASTLSSCALSSICMEFEGHVATRRSSSTCFAWYLDTWKLDLWNVWNQRSSAGDVLSLSGKFTHTGIQRKLFLCVSRSSRKFKTHGWYIPDRLAQSSCCHVIPLWENHPPKWGYPASQGYQRVKFCYSRVMACNILHAWIQMF